MRRRFVWPVRAFGMIAVVGVLSSTAFGGIRLLELRDLVGQRNSTLHESQAEVSALKTQVSDLDQQVAELGARADELRRQSSDLQALVDQKDQVVADLTSQVSQSVPAQQYAALQSQFDGVQQQEQALQKRLDSLVPIETPQLTGTLLYLDPSVQHVIYTQPLCSGSMEPTISCSDLLIFYRAATSDLAPGDIIYFRRQKPDCSGPIDGSFIVHRIQRVIAASSGLEFETKGDANPTPDACLVPIQDVLYKLLTSVRDARVSR